MAAGVATMDAVRLLGNRWGAAKKPAEEPVSLTKNV